MLARVEDRELWWGPGACKLDMTITCLALTCLGAWCLSQLPVPYSDKHYLCGYILPKLKNKSFIFWTGGRGTNSFEVTSKLKRPELLIVFELYISSASVTTIVHGKSGRILKIWKKRRSWGKIIYRYEHTQSRLSVEVSEIYRRSINRKTPRSFFRSRPRWAITRTP